MKIRGCLAKLLKTSIAWQMESNHLDSVYSWTHACAGVGPNITNHKPFLKSSEQFWNLSQKDSSMKNGHHN